MSVLEVRNLNVQYHTEQAICQAVRGVSFSVEKGEIAGIVGESGSGKSTAMRAVMGLLKSNARVTADEIRVSGESPRPGRNIAMIFQDSLSCLNPSVRIGRQIAETVRVREGCTWREAKKRALELLDLVGIRQPRIRMRQYPFELSGGMRQRVVIAIALACRPDLIIADEPTTALDAAVQAQILLLLRRIVRETGTSLLLVSHDLGVIASMCGSVYVMHSGEIVESGCAEDIFYAPREEYTRKLLERAAGKVPDMRRSRSKGRNRTNAGEDGNRNESADGRARTGEEKILVSLENVTREYDSHEGVRDISLTLEEGETYALVGESGSGKTTLARILSGILKPDGGSVLYRGREAAERERTGKIQMVFQDPAASLNPCLTAGQTLEEALRAADKSGEGRETIKKKSSHEKRQIWREKASVMLEQVGLSEEDMGKYPGSFSGGQRQRIAIARALINGPELLICDEALSSLDAVTGRTILELLLRFQRERGISILFISHDGKLEGVEFVELNMCPGGCVGGVLNVENPFIARNKMRQLCEKLQIPPATLEDFGLDESFFLWDKAPQPSTAFQLDPDRFAAMRKLVQVEELLKKLPGIDCGACGAPTCRCHAEDVVVSGGPLKCVKLEELQK